MSKEANEILSRMIDIAIDDAALQVAGDAIRFAYRKGRAESAQAILDKWGEYGLIEPWEAAMVARGDSDG